MKAPTLTLLLKAAAQLKGAKRKIRTGIIVMAAALLLKSRNEKMSRFQAINSVVFFAGHACQQEGTCAAFGTCLRNSLHIVAFQST